MVTNKVQYHELQGPCAKTGHTVHCTVYSTALYIPAVRSATVVLLKIILYIVLIVLYSTVVLILLL